jgi:polyisoprenoid-binding protein YceI
VAVVLTAFACLSGPAAFAAGPKKYVVAPGKGQVVRFEAATGVEKYAGTTDQVEGTVTVDPDNPAAAPSATITVRTAALRTGNGSRDSNMRRKHLQVDLFPAATFTLSGIETEHKGPLPAGQAVPGALVGRFTLHGVTRDIRPTGSVTREPDPATGRDSLHLVARFVVRLDDYKIPVPRLLFMKVKQEHPILVDLRAVAEK